MKRTTVILSLIFALAIALSVSIPTMAADPDKDVVITGTVPAVIDVTVNDYALELSGNIIPDVAAVTAVATVTIHANQDWDLDVQATNAGKMWTVGTHANSLINEMVFTGGDLGPVDLTGSPVEMKTGTKANDGDFPCTFSQTGDWDDVPGNYEITVTFTGSAAN